MAVRTAAEIVEGMEQYYYDSSFFLGRYFINRDRRKRGLPPLHPSF